MSRFFFVVGLCLTMLACSAGDSGTVQSPIVGCYGAAGALGCVKTQSRQDQADKDVDHDGKADKFVCADGDDVDGAKHR